LRAASFLHQQLKEDGMALMERVATLLRANVNDLVDRAEDPEKMLKQLLLDMENQLLQVKTQVAIAIADQHMLQKKAKEQQEAAAAWHGKAELALQKGKEEMARAALERALSHEQMGEGFAHQLEEQTTETAALRTSYNSLQHRRSRMAGKPAIEKIASVSHASRMNTLGRMKARIESAEAEAHAGREMLTDDSLEDDFAKMERDEKVERLLGELKQKQSRMLQAG
jgi:phage shock protein A